MSVTDHHLAARDAVVTTLKAVGGLPDVVAVDRAEDVPQVTSLPAVVVFPTGVQGRNEMSTNARDGWGWEIAVCLMSHGESTGSKSPDVPTAPAFERQVTVSFHNQRLSGVSENAWCEVQQAGELFDRDSPAVQKLRASAVVVAVGRYSRG